MGIKRTGSGGQVSLLSPCFLSIDGELTNFTDPVIQAALGFSAKKPHKSPAKKKTPIDLTASSPPRPTFALFNRPKSQTGKGAGTNPFDEDEDDEGKPDVANAEQVKRDEFGFVTTVPEDYAPLGKGETKEMIANLEPSADVKDSESDEAVEAVEEKSKLIIKDKKWDKVYKDTQEKMGGVDVQPSKLIATIDHDR